MEEGCGAMESGSVSDDVYLDVFTGLGDDGGGQRGRARGGGAWGGWKRDVERCEVVVACMEFGGSLVGHRTAGYRTESGADTVMMLGSRTCGMDGWTVHGHWKDGRVRGTLTALVVVMEAVRIIGARGG